MNLISPYHVNVLMILQILTWNVVMCVHDPIVPAKDRTIKLVHATRPLFVQKAWTHNHALPIIALPLREIVSTGLLVELEHFLSTCNLILELLSQNCKERMFVFYSLVAVYCALRKFHFLPLAIVCFEIHSFACHTDSELPDNNPRRNSKLWQYDNWTLEEMVPCNIGNDGVFISVFYDICLLVWTQRLTHTLQEWCMLCYVSRSNLFNSWLDNEMFEFQTYTLILEI